MGIPEWVAPAWLVVGIFAGFAATMIAAEADRFSGVQIASLAITTAALLPLTVLAATIYGVAIIIGEARRARRKRLAQERAELEAEYQRTVRAMAAELDEAMEPK